MSNGALQVIWSCVLCDYRSNPVPHHVADAYGVVVARLPIVEDFAGRYARCVVEGCGSEEVEWNHIAPRAIFGHEADKWGTVALCRRHHQEWGERVTPQLNPPRRAAS